MQQSTEAVARTREIEEFTNLRIIHPISFRLTRWLARLGVRPNTVSFAGMLCGVLAGVAYYHYRALPWTLAGFCLMVAWHVLDGTDGQLARLTNTQSEFGKIIDGICDYVTFIAVYLGLGFALQHHFGAAVWAVIVVAGLCHAVQSAVYEAQRQEYNFWGCDKQSAKLPRVADLEATKDHGAPARRVLNRLHILYVRMQYLGAGVTARGRELLAAGLQGAPAEAAAIRRRYRETFAPSVRRWAVLSANYRTLGIFVCAVLGVPLLYFMFEIIALSVVMMVLLRRQRGRWEGFVRTLGAAAAAGHAAD